MELINEENLIQKDLTKTRTPWNCSKILPLRVSFLIILHINRKSSNSLRSIFYARFFNIQLTGSPWNHMGRSNYSPNLLDHVNLPNPILNNSQIMEMMHIWKCWWRNHELSNFLLSGQLPAELIVFYSIFGKIRWCLNIREFKFQRKECDRWSDSWLNMHFLFEDQNEFVILASNLLVLTFSDASKCHSFSVLPRSKF